MAAIFASLIIITIAAYGARQFLRRMDERVKEVEALAAAVKAADAERARALKDIGETMDRIRAATSDLMRQEAKLVIGKGIAELEEARERARELTHV